MTILWSVVSWLLRTVIIQFFVMTVMLILLTVFVPMAVGYLTGATNTGGLTAAFSGLSSGVWYFLDYCQVPMGLPLLIAAWVSRFLIRRLPVIG